MTRRGCLGTASAVAMQPQRRSGLGLSPDCFVIARPRNAWTTWKRLVGVAPPASSHHWLRLILLTKQVHDRRHENTPPARRRFARIRVDSQGSQCGSHPHRLPQPTI
jgi:hypothetical protein